MSVEIAQGTRMRDLRETAEGLAQGCVPYGAPYVEKDKGGRQIGTVRTLGQLLFGFRYGFTGLVKIEGPSENPQAVLRDVDHVPAARDLFIRTVTLWNNGHAHDPYSLGDLCQGAPTEVRLTTGPDWELLIEGVCDQRIRPGQAGPIQHEGWRITRDLRAWGMCRVGHDLRCRELSIVIPKKGEGITVNVGGLPLK